MTLATKSFKISRGQGVREVEVFIQREIGRDLSLIKGIQAVSLNENTTQLTINYLTAPEKVLEISNPIPGLIVGSGTPPSGVVAQYASEFRPSSFTGGEQVQFDSFEIPSSNIHIETGGDNRIVTVDIGPYYNTDGTGIHNLLIDDNVIKRDGTTQQHSALVGFTVSSSASPFVGNEIAYTASQIRGVANVRYTILNTSIASSDRTLAQILANEKELYLFTTVRKSDSQTELFSVIVSDPEPRIVASSPPYGANHPENTSFNDIYLTYSHDLSRSQLGNAAVYSIVRSPGDTIDIPASYITLLSDDRTVKIDIDSVIGDYSITNQYISVIQKPGLLSANGVATTRAYLLPYATNDLTAIGGTGPQGPAGADGASGLIYAGTYSPTTKYIATNFVTYLGSGWYLPPGSPDSIGDVPPVGDWDLLVSSGQRGEQGPQGVQGPQGDQGISGLEGAQGAQGIQGDQGVSGLEGAAGADGQSGLIWAGEYSSTAPYIATNVVQYLGSGWVLPPGSPDSIGDIPPAGNWSLLAASGATGLEGSQGPQGATGPAGSDGSDGAVGASGLIWEGTWTPSIQYTETNVVGHLGSSYVLPPGSSPVKGDEPGIGGGWELLAASGTEGTQSNGSMWWRGAWEPTRIYLFGDVVQTPDGDGGQETFIYAMSGGSGSSGENPSAGGPWSGITTGLSQVYNTLEAAAQDVTYDGAPDFLDVLMWTGGSWKNIRMQIQNLSNFGTNPAPAEGHYIKYTTGQFRPSWLGPLDDHEDVFRINPGYGSVLTYNDTSGDWIDQTRAHHVASYPPSNPVSGHIWLDTSVDGTSSINYPHSFHTGDYTVTNSDTVVYVSGAGSTTVTLPHATGSNEKVFYIKNLSTGSVVVTGGGLIDNELTQTVLQYESMQIHSNNVNWFIL